MASPSRCFAGRAPTLALWVGAIVLGCSLSSGCTPHFDWRDYRDPDGWIATFPGKVQTAARAIDLDGSAVTMTMHAARVDDTAFAIGAIALPGRDEAALQKAAQAVARGLVQNIAGVIQKDERTTVARQLPDSPAVPVRLLEVTGSSGGKPLHMSARIAVWGDHVYQVMVVGPAQTLGTAASEEAVDTFMSSVRLP